MPDGVLRGTLDFQVGKGCRWTLRALAGSYHLSDGCAVQGNRRANPRVNPYWLGGIQFLDVHRAQIVAESEMDGLTGLLIEFLQIGKTQVPNVEMAKSRLAQSKAGHSEMESTVAGGIQEAT